MKTFQADLMVSTIPSQSLWLPLDPAELLQPIEGALNVGETVTVGDNLGVEP